MQSKSIASLFCSCSYSSIQGNAETEISGIAYDSRMVKPGFCFFALQGIHTDGHNHIPHAIDMGACAIVHTKTLKEISEITEINPNVTYIRVKDPKKTMSQISSIFYAHPSKKLCVIGITGTDGKSTTSYLIYQLLTMLGKKSGLLTTVYYDIGDGPEKNPYRQSTPEAPIVQSLLHRMVVNGLEYAVIEATSHGLSEVTCRLSDVNFDVAVLTNISHEHLEFHGSIENYTNDKANLFRKATRFGIINSDDPYREKFSEALAVRGYTYSLTGNNADCFTEAYTPSPTGNEITICYQHQRYHTFLPLPGVFNIENTLAAILCIMALLKIPVQEIIPHIISLKSVKGRMYPLRCGQPFHVLVDYAHTPGSFTKLFPLIRETTKEKVIAVFGSAGERDIEKRNIQGGIADQYSDIIFLTDEDPRGEEPLLILRDIASGCRNKKIGVNLFLIPNRENAMRKAFNTAQPGDTVLLLGKGHEDCIIYESGKIAWDEISVAEKILLEMGYKKKIVK